MKKFLSRFFSLKPEEISRTEPGFEEGEHRTPWTGVVLLVIMFIAGLFFGWRALDDLARVPSRPPELSYCSERYRNLASYQNSIARSPLAVTYPGEKPFSYSYEEPPCLWADLEIAAGLPAFEEQRRALVKSLRELNTATKQELTRAEAKRGQLETQYDERLQEFQAGVPTIPIAELEQLRQNLETARADEIRLQGVVDQQTNSAINDSAEIKEIDRKAAAAYESVFDEQNGRLRWYELQVFLLQLLFMLPLFLLALRTYVRQMRRNSPYAIILTAVVAVAGVLLLRVILTWFWDLFLARLIEVLWEWIQNFEILRSLVFYFGMVLSFVVFGGAVYYLQKRIFDPRRVAIRRFRQNECPQCQTTLDLAKEYCPNCGHHIREQCPNCSKDRFIELPHCPHCGSKKS